MSCCNCNTKPAQRRGYFTGVAVDCNPICTPLLQLPLCSAQHQKHLCKVQLLWSAAKLGAGGACHRHAVQASRHQLLQLQAEAATGSLSRGSGGRVRTRSRRVEPGLMPLLCPDNSCCCPQITSSFLRQPMQHLHVWCAGRWRAGVPNSHVKENVGSIPGCH